MPAIRHLGLITVLTLTGAWAASAQAGGVQWSVGVHAPIGPGVAVGTVISSRPYAPVVVAPTPVVYAPPVYVTPAYAPAVYVPAPVLYAPPVYLPPRVVVAPVWVGGRWVHRHHQHGHHGWRNDHRGPHHVPRHPGRAIRY